MFFRKFVKFQFDLWKEMEKKFLLLFFHLKILFQKAEIDIAYWIFSYYNERENIRERT